MKRFVQQLTLLAALSCITGAQAAGMTQEKVARDYTDVVAPAQQQAYEAGTKTYNKCLHDHGFKYKWTALAHETGNTYSYSYVSDFLTWADFDALHVAAKPCDSVLDTAVNPHLKSESSAFMTLDPDMSNMPSDTSPAAGLIEVETFTLTDAPGAYEKFQSSVKMIYAAIEKSGRPGHSMMLEVADGGSDAPDFILVMPHASWADLGRKINPPLWTMMKNVYGAKKAQQLRKTLDEVVKHTTSHVDAYDAELTYTPAGH